MIGNGVMLLGIRDRRIYRLFNHAFPVATLILFMSSKRVIISTIRVSTRQAQTSVHKQVQSIRLESAMQKCCSMLRSKENELCASLGPHKRPASNKDTI